MQERVGNTHPSPTATDDIGGRLNAIGVLKPYSVNLSADELQRTTKFHPGGERIILLIAALAEKYLAEFPGLSIEGMNNDRAQAQPLRSLAAETKALFETSSDAAPESDCWWVTAAYYSSLVRIARSNPKLADELRPAVDFFATSRRKMAQAESPTT